MIKAAFRDLVPAYVNNPGSRLAHMLAQGVGWAVPTKHKQLW